MKSASFLSRFLLSSVSSPVLPYFSTLSHKWHDFLGGGGEVIEHKMCVLALPLQLLSETFLTPRRIQEGVIMLSKFLCKVTIILVRF